jgi:hypothetical protein
MILDPLQSSSAIISDCGKFRYALTRRWSEGPTALFIMLNPSTADANMDDPTIRRCVGFAKREGCGGIRVENLYAFRATSPDEMFLYGYNATGNTDYFIREALSEEGPVICAWGADSRSKLRASRVFAIINGKGVTPQCLGITKSGAPRHPLYVKKDAPLVPFQFK